MRQDAQLDLRVIGGEQRPAGLGDERGANLAAQLGAHGDVLQIGVGGAEAAGGRAGLAEARVQAAGGGIDQLGQRVDVGGFELGDFAVFEDSCAAVRAAAPARSSTSAAVERARARLRLRDRAEIHFIEEDFGELLRRIDVEFGAGELPDALVRARGFRASIVWDMAASAAGSTRMPWRSIAPGPARAAGRCSRTRRRVPAPRLRCARACARRCELVGAFAGGAGKRRVRVAQHQRRQGRAARWWAAADRNRASSRGGCRAIGPASSAKSFGSCTILGRCGIGKKFAERGEHLALVDRARRCARRRAPAKFQSRRCASRSLRFRARPASSVSQTAMGWSRGMAIEKCAHSAAGESSAA